MKSRQIGLISLIFLSSVQFCFLESDGFLKVKEQDQNFQQSTFERVVNFDRFTMELTTKNSTFISKIQLIPMQSTHTGSVFFNLKNNSDNQRGWKISLNKGQGYNLQNINSSQLQILKRIFHKKLGKLIIKNNIIAKIKLFQPIENEYCGFEISQLKNKCWRIDIYPQKYKRDLYKYVVHLKMCTGSEEEQKKFRKFTYLLNNKQLGKTSKE